MVEGDGISRGSVKFLKGFISYSHSPYADFSFIIHGQEEEKFISQDL